jgi:hypothetical protein
MTKTTIGLFGTCGGSTWRAPFMSEYWTRGIPFFNPVVDNWTPECAVAEADHLATDAIILFPVTDETTGLASLAEIGHGIRSVLADEWTRSIVIYIAPAVSAEVFEKDPVQGKESNKMRTLSLAHLAKQKQDNVYVVDNLEDMLTVSLGLYTMHQTLDSLRKYA